MSAKIIGFGKKSPFTDRVDTIFQRAGFQFWFNSEILPFLDIIEEKQPDLIIFFDKAEHKKIRQICQEIDSHDESILKVIAFKKSIAREKKKDWLEKGVDGFLAHQYDESLLLSMVKNLIKVLPVRKNLTRFADNEKMKLPRSSEALLLVEADGKILSLNSACRKLGEWKEKEVVGKNVQRFFTSSDDKDLTDGIGFLLSDKNFVNQSDGMGLVDANGEKIPVSFTALPLRNNEKNVSEVLLLLNDLRDRENRLKELQGNFDSWQQIFYAIGHPAIILDTDHHIEAANREVIFATGLCEEELVGRFCYEIFHNNAKNPPEGCPFESLLRNERAHQAPMDLQSLDGVYMVSCTPIFDSDRQFSKIMHIAVDISERKRTEEALKDSERRFRSLYENSTIGLYRTDPQGNILLANPTLVKMLGYESLEALQQRNLEKEGYEPAYPRRTFKRELEKRGQITGFEAAWIRKDGKTIYVREGAVVIRDENGNVKYYEGTVEDITEQKLAEQQLRESELKFRSLFDHSAESEFIIKVEKNSEFKILEFNKTAGQNYGYRDGELIGQNWQILFNPEKIERIKEIERQLLLGDVVNTNCQSRRKDGSLFPCSITAKLIELNNARLVFLITRDITERYEFEEKLRISEESYRNIFNKATDAIYIQDEKGVFIDVNEGAVKMYGYPREYFIGRTPEFLSAPGKNDFKKVMGCLEKAFAGEPQVFEFWGIDKNGRVFPKIVRLNKGTWFGKDVVVAFAIDVTEQKKAEIAVKQSEEKYRKVFDNAYEAFFLHEINRFGLPGKIVDVNITACNLLGYSREELLSMSIRDITSKSDFAKAKDFLQNIVFRGGHKFETDAIAKDGSLIPVEIKAQAFKYSGKDMMISVMRDLRERKESERKLLAASFQWRTTFDAMNDAIALIDLDEKIVRCNKSFAQIAAKPFSQLMGASIIDTVFGPGKRLVNCPILKSKKSLARESVVVNLNQKWYEIIIDPAKDNNGNLTGFVYIQKDITDQHLIQQELRDNEIKYRTLFEEANDAIFLMEKTTIIDCNRRALEMFGCERKDIIGKTPYHFSPPEQPNGENSRDVALQKIESAYSGKLPMFEWIHSKLDGTNFYAEVTLTPIELKGQKYLQAIVRDITERKLAEKALRESEERYRQLIQRSNDAIYLLYNRKFEIINDKFTEIFGVTEKEANSPDFDFMSLVAPESRPMVEERMRRLNAGEQLSPEYEFTAIDKNGEKIEFEASVSYIKYKDGYATQGILHNITERKRAERALRESEEKYRKLVEEAPDAIAIHCEGKIVFANKAGAKLIGAKSVEELIGLPIVKFLHPDYAEIVKERIKTAMKTKKALPKAEEKIVRLDGTAIDVEVVSIPITFEGKPAMQVIIHDISDRKRAEEQIKKDLHEKETLIKEIHHRVKNNLMVVTSLLGLQMRRVADKQAIEAFKDSINRIYSMALVHQKLYQSKNLSEVNFKEFISTIARHVVSNSPVANRVKLNMSLEDIYLNIEIAVPLGLLFNELMTNATKHAFPDERIGQIDVSFNLLSQNHCELIVKDDGIGLPEDLDFSGSNSLGLSLIRELAEQLEATIELKREKGTEFILRFVI